MPWKDIEKRRAAIRKHYYANREAYVEKAQNKRRKLRKWLYELKEASPCSDCGVSYPYYVMDFDHIGEKKAEINRLINMGSIKRLEEEIKECELVCSNCHRMRTYRRATEVTL